MVPHLKPTAVGVELAPVKEPDRVAPVEPFPVTVLDVVTEAVGCCPPEVPPPDPLQLPTVNFGLSNLVFFAFEDA